MAASVFNGSFIKEASLSLSPIRPDLREAFDFREVTVVCGSLNGQSMVQIGNSIVYSTVFGEIVSPHLDKPNEGRIFINVDSSGVSEAGISDPRGMNDNLLLSNYVERVLRGSKAIDTESLCVLGGKSVWSIRVDIRVVSSDGSLLDVCTLGALTGLLNFRHQSVQVEGYAATVFATHSREPVHLSVHHLPISSTFVLVDAGNRVFCMADPTSAEETTFHSTFSVACNQHGELCSIHKPGGVAIEESLVMACMEVSVRRAKEVSMVVQAALQQVRS